MGVGDILKSAGGLASMIPGVGTIAGGALGIVGGLLGQSEEEEAKKKAEEEAKQKAKIEEDIKRKQAATENNSSVATGETKITQPNAAATLGGQLQAGTGMPQDQLAKAGLGTASMLLNNGRY